MPQQTRRVVTGHDAGGRAVVLIDGAAPNAKLRKATGLVSTLLWVTEESPADNSGSADAAERDIGVAPPPRGSIFRVVDFPPSMDFGAVDTVAMLREMGLGAWPRRSEEHTSELQSPYDLVCRLLLEKKKHNNKKSSPSSQLQKLVLIASSTTS